MKKFGFLFILLSLSGSLMAQVKFNLSYQEDTRTYTVSIKPETTYSEPGNVVSSIQVVLRAKFSENFTPIINSKVEGLVWSDNAYVDFPVENPQYTFVCIALANGPTRKINFQNGVETPLFSFINAGGSCPGTIELLPNDEPAVQSARNSGYNVTQHLAVLAARGNAFAGVLNGNIACATTGIASPGDKIIADLQISPIPADRSVNIRWRNLTMLNQRTEMVITDNRSREVYRDKTGSLQGENSVNIDVSNWPAGAYSVRFQFDNGGQTRGWHFMVIR